MFAIMLGDTVVGELQLKQIDHDKKECTLSIHMQNDAVKGKGYGTQAERLAVKIAFDELGMAAVNADEEHPKSARAGKGRFPLCRRKWNIQILPYRAVNLSFHILYASACLFHIPFVKVGMGFCPQTAFGREPYCSTAAIRSSLLRSNAFCLDSFIPCTPSLPLRTSGSQALDTPPPDNHTSAVPARESIQTA